MMDRWSERYRIVRAKECEDLQGEELLVVEEVPHLMGAGSVVDC